MSNVKFASWVLSLLVMIVNNKNEKNDWGKCLGLPVTSYYWVKLAIVSDSV